MANTIRSISGPAVFPIAARDNPPPFQIWANCGSQDPTALAQCTDIFDYDVSFALDTDGAFQLFDFAARGLIPATGQQRAFVIDTYLNATVSAQFGLRRQFTMITGAATPVIEHTQILLTPTGTNIDGVTNVIAVGAGTMVLNITRETTIVTNGHAQIFVGKLLQIAN